MNFVCELRNVIAQLPCPLRIGQVMSLTIHLINSVTLDSVNSYNLALCAIGSEWFPWSRSYVLMDNEELDDNDIFDSRSTCLLKSTVSIQSP
jgi:hypothetical protein